MSLLNVLALNPGSSTLKFKLFEIEGDNLHKENRLLASGVVERIDSPNAVFKWKTPERPEQPLEVRGMQEAAKNLLQTLQDFRDEGRTPVPIDAVGCRVVHGGDRFRQPALLNENALEQLRALSDLAPLHNPPSVAVIESAKQFLPNAPVVAVFDTAFHRTLPPEAFRYALPFEQYEERKLRRYGFHGISYAYASKRLSERAKQAGASIESKFIVCHLGNGSSVCAIRNGASVDTSMGLTPLEGLMMGTRSGDVDPGLLLHLLTACQMSAEQVSELLNEQSGLLGVSGISADMRDLEQAAQKRDPGGERAQLAIEMFAYRVCKYIGAYAAVLEGLDAIAFTGGIGEHSASMRQRICRRLGFLGVSLDETRNQNADGHQIARITGDSSAVEAWVIPAEEEKQIALETAALLSIQSAQPAPTNSSSSGPS